MAKPKCAENVRKFLKLYAHFGLALPKRTSFCRFLFIMVIKHSIGKGGVGIPILLGGTNTNIQIIFFKFFFLTNTYLININYFKSSSKASSWSVFTTSLSLSVNLPV